MVADSSFAALDFIAAVRRHVTLITRLRLDANLFEPAPARVPGRRGRPALKGKRVPKLDAVLRDPAHRLDKGDADRMVRRPNLQARIHLGHGALVQGRPAAPADPLGAGARSVRHP